MRSPVDDAVRAGGDSLRRQLRDPELSLVGPRAPRAGQVRRRINVRKGRGQIFQGLPAAHPGRRVYRGLLSRGSDRRLRHRIPGPHLRPAGQIAFGGDGARAVPGEPYPSGRLGLANDRSARAHRAGLHLRTLGGTAPGASLRGDECRRGNIRSPPHEVRRAEGDGRGLLADLCGLLRLRRGRPCVRPDRPLNDADHEARRPHDREDHSGARRSL